MKSTLRLFILLFLGLSSFITLQSSNNVFTEDFSKFTRTDVSVNNRAKILPTDALTTAKGWIVCSGARQNGGALKLGQGSTIGYVTTPKLNLSGGSITVNINAAQYIKPTSPAPATYKVAVLVDGTKVGELNVGMAWRDVNHTDAFPSYSLSGIPAATANSRITIEVGNTANGGTASNSVVLDQIDVLVNGTNILSESFDNFTLGYSWTWNQTWDGATTYTSNAPTDLFPFISGEVSTELDSRTQTTGWKGKAIFENGGKAVIGWEQKWNSATTEAAYPGYLTTPSIEFKAGDVLSYTVGTNVGLVGNPSAPTLNVLTGDISSTTIIGTPVLPSSATSSAATAYTYTFTSDITTPITFKLGGTSTKDEIFISNVTVTRTATGIDLYTEEAEVRLSVNNKSLILFNAGELKKASIYSLSGLLLHEYSLQHGENILELSRGIYLVKVGNQAVRKVVI
jgi:hypothetical protein